MSFESRISGEHNYVRARLTIRVDAEVKVVGGGKCSVVLDVPVVLLHALLLFLVT